MKESKMETPIIEPWIIYFISMTEKTSVVVGFSLLMLIMGVAVMPLILDIHNIEVRKIHFISPFIIFVILAALLVLIPNKETIYQMIAAKHITPANVQKVINTGKDLKSELKNDVIEIIKSIKSINNKGE
jgi:hypothetical protein